MRPATAKLYGISGRGDPLRIDEDTLWARLNKLQVQHPDAHHLTRSEVSCWYEAATLAMVQLNAITMPTKGLQAYVYAGPVPGPFDEGGDPAFAMELHDGDWSCWLHSRPEFRREGSRDKFTVRYWWPGFNPRPRYLHDTSGSKWLSFVDLYAEVVP